MSARWLLVICAALALGSLAACRELTAPGGSPGVGGVRLLVLDENGEPVRDRDVLVTNIGFVRLQDEDEWRERTDENGTIVTEVPPGRYTVVVWSNSPWFDRWLEPEIDLVEGVNVIDPRPYLVRGTVSIPEDLDVDLFSLELDAQWASEIRDLYFASRARVSEDGEILCPWIAEADYTVDLSDYPTRVRLHEEFNAAPGDSLHFEWVPDQVQIRLTLGGEPFPPNRVSIIASTPGAAVITRVTAENSLVTIYCKEGFGEIEIGRDYGHVPFLGYVAPFEFRSDTIRHIELGEHRVRLRFLDASGRDFYGCTFRVEEAISGWSASESGDGPDLDFFLRSGSYALWATHVEGYRSAVTTAHVTSDTTFTFVLVPEEQ